MSDVITIIEDDEDDELLNKPLLPHVAPNKIIPTVPQSLCSAENDDDVIDLTDSVVTAKAVGTTSNSPREEVYDLDDFGDDDADHDSRLPTGSNATSVSINNNNNNNNAPLPGTIPSTPKPTFTASSHVVINNGVNHVDTKKGKKREFADWEIKNLEEGVRKFGRKWTKILETYQFDHRSTAVLAAKWKALEQSKANNNNSNGTISTDDDNNNNSDDETFSSQLSQSSTASVTKQASKQQKQQEKKRKAEEKAILTEHKRRARGDFAHQEIRITIDQELADSTGGDTIISALQQQFPHVKQQRNLISSSIELSRSVPKGFLYCTSQQFAMALSQSQNSQDVDTQLELSQQSSSTAQHYNLAALCDRDEEESPLEYLVVRLLGDVVVDLIEADGLVQYVASLIDKTKTSSSSSSSNSSSSNNNNNENADKTKTIILVIEGLERSVTSRQAARYKNILNNSSEASQNKKKKKTTSSSSSSSGEGGIDNPKTLDKSNIERCFIQLQLRFKASCFVIHTKNNKESAEYINLIIRYIADMPYKKQAVGSTPRCTTARISFDEVWMYQLTQIPKITEKIAQTITKKYPTASSLLSLYYDHHHHHNNNKERETLSENEKEELLKDLIVEYGVGEGSRLDKNTSRRVGPVASRRIYNYFMCQDGTTLEEDL